MKNQLNSAPLYHNLLQMSARPGMYIGRANIEVFVSYLMGFRAATVGLGIPNRENPPFRLFKFWVKYNYPKIKQDSWSNILLKKNRDDGDAALVDFFKLFIPFSKLKILTGYHAKALDYSGKKTDVFIFGWGHGFYSRHQFHKPLKHWTDVYLSGGRFKELSMEYPEKFEKLSGKSLKRAENAILAIHDQDFGF